MAGTVIADKVQAQSTSTLEIMNGVALTPPRIEDVNGVEIGSFCRAWVNFNGTGTVAIRASFNVSSITDNGAGDYRVNFTNAMPDANYSVQSQCFSASNNNNGNTTAGLDGLLTGSVRILTGDAATGGSADSSGVFVAVFR
jgi:hypothetical protein